MASKIASESSGRMYGISTPEYDSLARLAQQQARLSAFVGKHCNQGPIDTTVETMDSILARFEALIHFGPAERLKKSA